MTKGEVGVWNSQKKDDVIYEEPLKMLEEFSIKIINDYEGL